MFTAFRWFVVFSKSTTQYVETQRKAESLQQEEKDRKWKNCDAIQWDPESPLSLSLSPGMQMAKLYLVGVFYCAIQ